MSYQRREGSFIEYPAKRSRYPAVNNEGLDLLDDDGFFDEDSSIPLPSQVLKLLLNYHYESNPDRSSIIKTLSPSQSSIFGESNPSISTSSNPCHPTDPISPNILDDHASYRPSNPPPSPPRDGEVDSLDAFMNGLDEDFNQQQRFSRQGEELDTADKRVDAGMDQAMVTGRPSEPFHHKLENSHLADERRVEEEEEEDMIESFVKHRTNKLATDLKQQSSLSSSVGTGGGGFLHELEYDSDDNPIIKKRVIHVLLPLDHSKIEYEPFERVFLKEHPSVSAKTDEEIQAYRRSKHIHIDGKNVARPVTDFEHMGLGAGLLKVIKQQGFVQPTPIQEQAISITLSGRDIIGIAQTGSGKTAAFVLPLITHILDQRQLEPGEGPIAIIVAPTRELSQQIYNEVRKYGRPYGIRIAPIVGGIARGEMRRILKNQLYEVLVATPGRLIDLFKNKLISNHRITFLVLDEADKFFEMGFEPQVRSIIGQIRPDRQMLLFSATFKPVVQQLARETLNNPVLITIGNPGSANRDVTQVVEIIPNNEEKWPWLALRIADFVLDGSVLIFAGSKLHVEELCSRLQRELNCPSVALHGDRMQDDRMAMMQLFNQGKVKVMVATDIAARGLDVKGIKTVVNYYSSRDIDSHIHRIGRTGRAGDKQGIAYSLLTPNESHFAALLLENLEKSGQDIPSELVQLAMQNPKFRKKGWKSSVHYRENETRQSHHSDTMNTLGRRMTQHRSPLSSNINREYRMPASPIPTEANSNFSRSTNDSLNMTPSFSLHQSSSQSHRYHHPSHHYQRQPLESFHSDLVQSHPPKSTASNHGYDANAVPKSNESLSNVSPSPLLSFVRSKQDYTTICNDQDEPLAISSIDGKETGLPMKDSKTASNNGKVATLQSIEKQKPQMYNPFGYY